MSVNFFSSEAEGEGGIVLTLMLLVIGAAVLATVVKKKWTAIVAGVLSTLGGLVAVIDGFGTMARIGSFGGVSVGAGAVLLGVFGLALLVGAVFQFMSVRDRSVQKS